MKGVPEYALERLCMAPPERVWRGWTDPAVFARWYGPNVETIVHKMDVSPGGDCLIEMKWEEGALFQKFHYLEVTPHQKLSWVFTATDQSWVPIPSPLMEHWPAQLITTIKLEQQRDNTLLHLSWTPLDATEREINTFKQARLDIDQGWNAALTLFQEVALGQSNNL